MLQVCYHCLCPEEPNHIYTTPVLKCTYFPEKATTYCGECGGIDFFKVPEVDDSVVISILKAVHEYVTGKRDLVVERTIDGKTLKVYPHPADIWSNAINFAKSLDLFPNEQDFLKSLPEPKLTPPNPKDYSIPIRF